MLQFFRKVRRELIDKGNLRRYLIYAIGEILLVMIGILLAIQVNNWNNEQIENAAGKKFYENFKRQISDDLQVIDEVITYNNIYRNQFNYAIKIIEENDQSKMDTLGYIAMKLTKYSDFDRPSNIYESVVNSGEIRFIENEEIIERIQILEESYIYFNRMEDIHYDLIMSIVPELITLMKYSDRSVEQPGKLYNYIFQNILITAADVMSEKDEVYLRAKGQIENLMILIDNELGEERYN